MRECQLTLEAEMTAGEQAYLLSLVGEHTGKHMEIGTAAGGTLWRMMRCFEESKRPAFVVVDPMRYFPEQFATVQRNLREHGVDPGRVDFRMKTSCEAFAECTKNREMFDFVLVDGNHKIMAVTEDLAWTSLVNVGGIICFHDFTRAHKGVLLAVRRFLCSHENYQPIGLKESMLAVRKIAADSRPAVPALNYLFAVMWYLPLQIERKIDKWKDRKRQARLKAAVRSQSMG